MKIKQFLVAFACFAVLALPARAADTITITITTNAALCSAGCTKVYSDPTNTMGTKIVSTYQAACNISINGICTPLQVANFWALVVRNNLVNDVTNFDQGAASAAAAAAVVKINPQ